MESIVVDLKGRLRPVIDGTCGGESAGGGWRASLPMRGRAAKRKIPVEPSVRRGVGVKLEDEGEGEARRWVVLVAAVCANVQAGVVHARASTRAAGAASHGRAPNAREWVEREGEVAACGRRADGDLRIARL